MSCEGQLNNCRNYGLRVGILALDNDTEPHRATESGTGRLERLSNSRHRCDVRTIRLAEVSLVVDASDCGLGSPCRCSIFEVADVSTAEFGCLSSYSRYDVHLNS